MSNRLLASAVSKAVGRAEIGEPDYPRSLFGFAEDGAILRPFIPYLFLDAARTTPITAPGDPVGGATDLSGNGNHFSQPSDPDRPIYGIVPVGGRRNLLEWTEDLLSKWSRAHAGGSIEPVTLSNGDAGYRFDVTDGRDFLQRTLTLPAGTYTISVYAENVIFDQGGIPALYFTGANTDSRISVLVGDDFVRYDLEFTLGAEETGFVRLGVGTTTTADRFLGDLGLPQIEKGGLTPYQRVGNQFDVTEKGVRSLHYLDFNGVNQELETPPLSVGSQFFACAAAQAMELSGDTVERHFFGPFLSGGDRADLGYRLSGGSVGRTVCTVRVGAGTQSRVSGGDAAMADLKPHIVSGGFQAGAVFIRHDGEDKGSVDRSESTTFSAPIRAGYINGAANRLYGGVYVMGDNLHTASQKRTEKYLANHAGVTL